MYSCYIMSWYSSYTHIIAALHEEVVLIVPFLCYYDDYVLIVITIVISHVMLCYVFAIINTFIYFMLWTYSLYYFSSLFTCLLLLAALHEEVVLVVPFILCRLCASVV